MTVTVIVTVIVTVMVTVTGGRDPPAAVTALLDELDHQPALVFIPRRFLPPCCFGLAGVFRADKSG